LGWQQLVKKSLEQCQRSFGVECSDRIEAHGAQRRDVTGGDGDGGEHDGDAGEGRQIVGRDTVKQAGHETRYNKRASQAYARAGRGQREALAQNHPEDIAPLRAQREANGDLARLLIDDEGNGSVDSQAREQQGSCGKQRHHLHGEPPHGERRGEHVVQGLGMEDGYLRIDGLDLRAHLRGDGGGIDLSTQVERKKLGGALVDVNVHLRSACVRKRFRARVGCYADDGDPVRPGGPEPDVNALAERVLFGPVLARSRLIDDRDGGCVFKVLVDEEAPTQQRHAEQVKVFGRDDRRIDQGRLAALRVLALADQLSRPEIALAMAQGKPRRITDSGFFHARQRPDATESFAQEHRFLRGGVVNVGAGIVGIRKRGLDCHHSSGIEAELHLEQVPETAQQEAGGDHQHQGEG
jgi:hypothetical protein